MSRLRPAGRRGGCRPCPRLAPMGSEIDEIDRRAPDGTVAGVVNPRARQRALAIGISDSEPDERTLAELRELLRTAGVATAGELVQRRPEPDPDRYFGRGKLAELKQAAQAADANLIACDDELLPRQERNLEKELGLPVIDRTAVILDIFADHAHSSRGQAPGRARPARVQPRPHAGPVDPPRAARRRPHGRGHRHPRPRRVADRDRPPPRAGADQRPAAAPRRGPQGARDDARRRAAARSCRRSPSPGTRTPASRRC